VTAISRKRNKEEQRRYSIRGRESAEGELDGRIMLNGKEE
jgi:hypothetical protein